MSECTSESIAVAKPTQSLMPNREQRRKLRMFRQFKDQVSRYGVMAAGLAAVFSLGLIFFYLFSEIAPLFRDASVTAIKHYTPAQLQQQASDPIEHLSLERYEEIGASFKRSGRVHFFNVNDGREILKAHHRRLPRQPGLYRPCHQHARFRINCLRLQQWTGVCHQSRLRAELSAGQTPDHAQLAIPSR